MKRWPAIASFMLFIALCVSVAYWSMQLFKPPLRPVAAPPPSVQTPPRIDAAAGLFGGRSTAAVASNYQLRGVVVSGTASDSVAILSADGKPAQAVRANMEIAPGVTVKEVHRRYVLLSDGGVSKRVELPEDAKGLGGPDMAGRSPVPARGAAPTPQAQAQSAADLRRAAMPSQPPATPAQSPEQTGAPGMSGSTGVNPTPNMGVPPGMGAQAPAGSSTTQVGQAAGTAQQAQSAQTGQLGQAAQSAGSSTAGQTTQSGQPQPALQGSQTGTPGTAQSSATVVQPAQQPGRLPSQQR